MMIQMQYTLRALLPLAAAFLYLQPSPAAAQNVKPEEQTYLVRYADMLTDKADIVIDDAQMRAIVCSGLPFCRMNLSTLTKKVQAAFHKSMLDMWKTTECGTRFNASFSEYDCGQDHIPDAMIHFTGYHLFDCDEYDDSGIYAFVTRIDNGDFVLKSSMVSWKRNSVDLSTDGRFSTIINNDVGMGMLDFQEGTLGNDCHIVTVMSSSCPGSDGVVLNDMPIAMAKIEHFSGKITTEYYGLCGLITDEKLEMDFIDRWRMNAVLMNRMLSGNMKNKEDITGRILSTDEISRLRNK